MDQPGQVTTASPSDKAPAKGSWEAVLTITPVILTVLGTLLAGLSSSEMTLAQYHRSLAAQNQSKVGDQWNFFQAKRIRGQNLESSGEALPVYARPGKIDPEQVQTAATRVVQRLQGAEKSVQRLDEAVTKAENGVGTAGDPLRGAVAALLKTAQDDVKTAEKKRNELTKELAKPEVRAAFAYLGTNKLPEVKDAPYDDPRIEEVLQGIADRRPESEQAATILQIHEDVLRKAIDTAESNARAFELAGKPVNTSLDRLDQLIRDEVTRAASFHQAVVALDLAMADVPEGSTKALVELHAAAHAVTRSDAAVKGAAEELNTLVKAARYDYNARRYNREARYNQKSAGLYEIEVRRNSVAADRHRTRSKQFFYGMLCAQAGVAIASLSLAAKQKSLLWALAGLAGLTAVVFSGYVYLYM